MSEERVDVEIEEHEAGRVARLTLANERRLNAGSRALVSRLREALAALEDDPALRCVVLTGAGERAFMGGADINELATFDAEGARAMITNLHEACLTVRRFPVPVIGRLRGYCLGAGLELAASCDFRAGDTSFVMGMPETRVGLPSVIEAALLPHLIGWGHAREMVLTGDTYDAATAERWGFLQRLVAPEELDGVVDGWIASILASGPRAVRLQKRLCGDWEDLPLARGIEAGIDCIAAAYETDEPQRMMAPFFARKQGG